MKKIVLLSTLLFSFFALFSYSLAAEVIVSGPNQYVRTDGVPNMYENSFRAVDGVGLLQITNGTEGDKKTIVSIAEVWVNGEQLFGPSDFNKTVLQLEAQVNLTDTNSIKVVLKGKPGSYLAVSIVEDIAPPSVSLSVNPQEILLGAAAKLTWNTTLADTVTIDNGIGEVAVNGAVDIKPVITTTYNVTATGLGGTVTESATLTVFQPPTVTLSADPATISFGSSSQLTWDSTHADSVTITPDIGSVAPSGTITVSPSETTNYNIIASGQGGTASDNVSVEVLSADPFVSIIADPETIPLGSSTLLTWHSARVDSVHIDNGNGTVGANGSLSVSPEHTTTYTINGTGPEGISSSQVTVYVNGNPEPQPEGMFGELYNNLIPQDATVESYDERRFSVITGLVHDESGLPLDNVAVTIHAHPEYGTVTTDTEGRFSIPIEGGAVLTVVYKKQGSITSHRQVQTTWNDIAIAETIQMLPEDEKSTMVAFDGNPATVITHTSTEITDEFGSRSATVTFTGDNRVFLVDENGNDIQELPSINVRATEYVTPESMPAALPPNSAYTYCTELKVDNAERVRFEKPVPMWVDNFLGFDVGEIVPVGYYDRDKALWIPSDNGVVVRLLDTDNDGTVDALDSTGDDQPDDLNNNGSLNDEVTGLTDTDRYQPGATFWRAEVKHFSPWDCNWPYGPPADAEPPNAPNPDLNPNNPPCDECSNTNSYVKHKTRVFHEDIPIPGTDLTLHYASNRVKGYKQVISIPASGDTVPDSLKSIIVKLEVAGRTYVENLPPEPDQGVEFVWDGKDNLGNQVEGASLGKVSIGYVYDAVYGSAGNFLQAFAQTAFDLTDIRARREIISWKRSEVILSHGSKDQQFGNGWTLSNHHHLILSKVLQKGNGTSEAASLEKFIDTIAGTSSSSWCNDPYYPYCYNDAPATKAPIGGAGGVTYAVAVDNVGNIFTSFEYFQDYLLKINTEGIISSIGNEWATSIAFDNKNNMYILKPSSDYAVVQVLKYDNFGNRSIVVNKGGGWREDYWRNKDGSPAIYATLYLAQDITIDMNNDLFITDSGHHRIIKVDPNGIITTVAGNGTSGFSGDNGPAVEAKLNFPTGIAVDQAGNIYFSDYWNQRIRKVDTRGVITTIAGNGERGFLGDGGPAIDARLNFPYGITLDQIGNIYFTDSLNNRIRKVTTDGTILTIAGNGEPGFSGDNGHPLHASLGYPRSITIDSSGNIYVATGYNRIRKISKTLLYQRLSLENDDVNVVRDGSTLTAYVFDQKGFHISTNDYHSGTVLSSFLYDDHDNLISIKDRFDNTVTIERNDSGSPIAIISPYGHRTELTVNDNGNLVGVTYENNTSYSFIYTDDGLMTAMTNPRGLTSTHDFDDNGRVISTEDPENGIWTLERTAYTDGSFSSSITSSEENTTSHLDTIEPGDVYRSITTTPGGDTRTFVRENQGLDETVKGCGMTTETSYTLDKKSKRKIPEKLTTTTPAGLTNQLNIANSYVEDTDGLTLTATTTLNQNGKTTTAVTDYQAGTAATTSPEGRVSSTTFDIDNLLVTDTGITGLLPTHFEYDTNGRLTRVTTGERSTSYNYGTRGNLVAVVDPLNRTTSYTHDLLDHVTQIDRPDGSTIQFQYDAAGNMTVLTTPTPADNMFEYNGVNKPSRYTTPLNSVTTYSYDKERKLTSIAMPSGKTITNTYTNGRLSQTETAEWTNSISYACDDHPASITRGIEQIAYGYDGNLLTSSSQTGTLNESLSFTYNNDFNITSFTYGGGTESITYDNDGLTTGIGRYTITRNSGNGIPESVTDGAFTMNRTFNGYGELSAVDTRVAGSNALSWNLTRNNNGQITSKSETVGGITVGFAYSYDEVGRLLTVTKDNTLVEEYQYDVNGNRTYEMNTFRGIADRTLTYSVEDHIMDAGDVTYEFDYDDNLAARIDSSGTTEYQYSSTGELMRVTLPDTTLIEYVHDPLGRRIAKKVNGSIVEKYLWSGRTTLLAVYDGSDNMLQRFEYADGRMPYAMISEGSTYYLAYDQVGSLRLVTDTAGNTVKQVDYDSFGNIIADSNPSFTIPFGFAGGLHDRDTKLVRFGFRDYMPEIGKWTAKDPILFAGGDTNLYGYVLNDPVNRVDPEGLFLQAAYNFVLTNAPRAWAALDAAIDTWGPTAPSGKLALAKELGPDILEAAVQANQTLGECIVGSAEYLAMDAGHDIINNVIPAVLDGMAAGANWTGNEFIKATTPPVPQQPQLYLEQGGIR